MGMTRTQKLLARAAGLAEVKPGQLVLARLDRVLGNDITAPVAINEFRAMGASEVFDPNKVSLVMDHFAPNKDIKAATQCQLCRNFATEMGIAGFYDGGEMGVEHALLPEKGLVTAGDVIIGADSHTCTYGALGAFATGVGSTDMAVGMAKGKAWFKVPEAIRVVLTGRLGPMVSGKDLILTLIGMIGVDGALYQSLEFCGEGAESLSVSDRLCVCNMAIEAGAKNGIFPVDDLARAFLAEAGAAPPREVVPDPDATYARTIELDLGAIAPTVAFPHLPENTRNFDEIAALGPVTIDQVVIGSCTNGRLEDLQVAAEVLRGRTVAKGVRALVIPATQKIYLDAMEQGLLRVFIEAGALVSTPTCGPCLGGHMGILAPGERAVATTNRNFVGRMGHPESEVYLASPATAAASAVTGRITNPLDLERL
ncbi:MAG: 3-isopropylmalate dehydratase large subunit [Coriobacteriales bacterium]|jgi:3-isopropylmalate/(R)-2-methylmalate dehydratase large subunit|nr:3-isopropylmalate dehydratase large subunit [Coriobacteriales bacterium]